MFGQFMEKNSTLLQLYFPTEQIAIEEPPKSAMLLTYIKFVERRFLII